MRSLQDYIKIYKDIASNLNLQGDSVSVLVQMLANASYISEIEHAYYLKEASLESCSLLNTKIQHCMDLMYSVYRGLCPRVVINFTAEKYIKFDLFDIVTTSNNFKFYYSGYYDNEKGILVKSSCTLIPGGNYQLECILASETVDEDWKLTSDNVYYVDCTETNLSNDVSVKIRKGSETGDSGFSRTYLTTSFSDHIIDDKIFDLTTTGFGSRLFIPEAYRMANTEIKATYFKQSSLSDYNDAELKRVRIDGAELLEFSQDFLNKYNFDSSNELSEGLLYIDSVSSDKIETIHYKANHDRYVNSILRSNEDIGTIFEKTFEGKVSPSGTYFEFIGNSLNIWYIPYNVLNPVYLTDEEKSIFTAKDSTKKAYYITDTINIKQGTRCEAIFNIELELYDTTPVDTEINNILTSYSGKFKFNEDIENLIGGIKTTISKISNIMTIKNISIDYKLEGMSETFKGDSDTYKNLPAEAYFFINPNHTKVISNVVS